MPAEDIKEEIKQLTAAVNANTFQQGILIERVGNLKDGLDAHVKADTAAHEDYEGRLRTLEQSNTENRIKVGMLSSAVSAMTASIIAFVQYLTGNH